MRRVLAIIALLSCAASATAQVLSGQVNIDGGFPQNVVGNKHGVIISNVRNEVHALAVAERFCQQYRRSARFAYMKGYRIGYDCIP